MSALRLFASMGLTVGILAAQQTTTTTTSDAASTEPHKMEKFEVTGSRLKQVDVEGPSPIRIISRQEIEATGRTNLSELMRELPEASAIGINEGGTITAVRGATALDLRNLGPNNTLVIVDGRRQVLTGSNSGGVTFVDLNRFPIAMIERIEVLKDGASAIYGSDATAGVVNIITRKDFNGVEINSSYGNTTDTDAAEKSISIFGGASSGKFRSTVAVSYFERNALAANDREFSRNADLSARYLAKGAEYAGDVAAGAYDLRSGTGPQARISLVAGQVNGVNGVNIPGLAAGAAITTLPGTGRTSVTPSFTAPYVQGTGGQFNATAAATFVPQILSPGVAAPNNLYNFQPWVWLVPSTERKGLRSTFSYDITPSTQGYLEFSYQRNESETHLAPSPISTAGDNGIIVPKTNYWNPFGVDVSFNYRPIEVGPRIAKIVNDSYSLLAGVKGTIDDRWDWDVGYYYGFDEVTDTTDNSAVSESRLRAALALNTPKALNIFGGPGFKNDPATINSFKVSSYKAGSADMTLVDAKVSGKLMELPTGDLGVALYTEFREETFVEANDSLSTKLDDIIGQVRLADATSAYRNVTSFAAELGAPLVKPGTVPFIRSLELRGAVRYEDFSDGYDSGYKPYIGLRYQPVRSLVLRASYTEAFRAPTLPQLYGGERQSLPNALPDYARPQTLTGDPYDGSSTQRLVKAGGNPNLRPEESKSYQIGFVWDVPFKKLDGLSLETTFGEIEQEDIITTTGTAFLRSNEFGDAAGLIIREPGTETYTNNTASNITVYTGPGTRGSPGADKVVAPGQSITVPGRILELRDSYVNLAVQRIRYMDFGVRYNKRTTNMGRFSLRSSATYLIEYAFTRTAGYDLPNFVDRDGYARYRVQSSLAWERKEWGAGVSHNYTPGYGDFMLDGYYVSPYQTWNAYVSWTVPATVVGLGGTKLTLGVDNLLDKDPPLWYDGVGYDQSMVGRPQGRFLYVAMRKSF